jgi:elongator complex protein 3
MRPTGHLDVDACAEVLSAALLALDALPATDQASVDAVLRRHPRPGGGFFSRGELLAGLRRFNADGRLALDERRFVDRLRRKPVRTQSGVAPVTVLTKPFPCPGTCVFCPSDVRMPKSYLSSEPGAQRAWEHQFDPFGQTWYRLRAFHLVGHRVDKVELIVLGGTWSSYPEPYQRWFLARCFAAMNDFGVDPDAVPGIPVITAWDAGPALEGAAPRASYNAVVGDALQRRPPAAESASWEELAAVQRANETAGARCVGLSLETRPDRVDAAEVVRLRRLGATKIQVGVQSLDDAVLAANRRGHDVATTRRALGLLRAAGFKLQAHWMPNLLAATPAGDRADFARLFADPAVSPDELKVYPCSLIASAELMQHHATGAWQPYGREELVDLLADCLVTVPRWCRVSRVIRDIPSGDIVVGSRETNLREAAERRLRDQGRAVVDVRSRELRGARVPAAELLPREERYATAGGEEVFLELLAPGDRLAGFLRLALPSGEVPSPIPELATGRVAVIREVHVYGELVGFGEDGDGRAQHRGLGSRLVARAVEIARAEGYTSLAVISAVGTRRWYERLGFIRGELYHHLPLPETGCPSRSVPGRV